MSTEPKPEPQPARLVYIPGPQHGQELHPALEKVANFLRSLARGKITEPSLHDVLRLAESSLEFESHYPYEVLSDCEDDSRPGPPGMAMRIEGEVLSQARYSIEGMGPISPKEGTDLRKNMGAWARAAVLAGDAEALGTLCARVSHWAVTAERLSHMLGEVCSGVIEEAARLAIKAGKDDSLERIEANEKVSRLAETMARGVEIGAAVAICSRNASSTVAGYSDYAEEIQGVEQEAVEVDSTPASLLLLGLTLSATLDALQVFGADTLKVSDQWDRRVLGRVRQCDHEGSDVKLGLLKLAADILKEPEATEPEATEPEATDPEAAESEAAEPEAAQ